jgi:hypothetical protein
MNRFEQAMAHATQSAPMALAAEAIMLNGHEVEDAIVLDGGATTALSPTLGGITQQVQFTVHLTAAAMAQCRPAKGQVVTRKKTGDRGRISMRPMPLPGGGAVLTCGPEQTRDV